MVEVAALLNSNALQPRTSFAGGISSIISRKKESTVLGILSLFRALCSTVER